MGVIIVDGRTALRFKGSIAKFEKAVVGLSQLQKKIGGLKIETVPLPEKPTVCIEISFSGTMSEFEKVIVGLEKLKGSVAIDTVPLPERPAIGTWPTPERQRKALGWTIYVKSDFKPKNK